MKLFTKPNKIPNHKFLSVFLLLEMGVPMQEGARPAFCLLLGLPPRVRAPRPPPPCPAPLCACAPRLQERARARPASPPWSPLPYDLLYSLQTLSPASVCPGVPARGGPC